MGVDRRRDELILGLEVVVDVADRDVGSVGDVRECRPLDALLVQKPGGAVDEPLALAGRALALVRRALPAESVIWLNRIRALVADALS